ncbi:copper resistance protein CopC [Natrialbaceae archaeon A-arb3/5]
MTDSYRIARSNTTLLTVTLIVGALLLASLTAPVAAHAYLSESDPANGEQVDDVPEEVTLYFSGDGVVNADITVDGPDGEVVSEEPEIDPDDTQIVRVPIEDADGEDGMYSVDWEVLADDGHTTSGSFFFAVGDEPLDRDAVLEAYEPDEEDESIPPFEAGAKGLLLVGVAGLIGIPAIAALAVGPVFARTDASRRTAVDRRLTRLLAGAVGLTLVSALALGLARSTALGPLSVETVAQFAGTPLGETWLGQVVLSAALVAFVVAMTRGFVDQFVAYIGTFVGGLGIAGTIAWTSHSATAIDQLQGTLVDFAHIVGAGLWVGGLAVLALVVVPAVRNAHRDDRRVLLADTIRRFSILALVGVTLVVSTGFVLASWHVPAADGLTEAVYGLTLVAKLLLVAAALALGGLTRFVLLGRLESRRSGEPTDDSRAASTDGGADRAVDGESRTVSRIARSVRVEVTLLVVVLLLSGVLTSAPTAAVAGMDSDEPIEASIEFEYDDGLVEVTALPAATESADDSFELRTDEPIIFEVSFLDDGEPVESDQSVRLLASGEDGTQFEVELEETDDGSYATVQPLPAEGEWELRITGAPDGSYVSEWIDATVLPADGQGDGHDHSDDHDHDDGHDPDHGDGDDHDHDTESTTPFQALLQLGAVATLIVGVLAITLESLRIRGGRSG